MTRLGQSRDPDLSEVLRAAMQAAIDRMFVALPGKVTVYDAATQTADVQPLLKRPVIYDDGQVGADELPIIPGVPVAFPRGGQGFFITFPMKPGDLVLLVFCDRSIDKYKTSGGTVATDPIDLRTNDISDAVAIPGFYTLPNVLKDGTANSADMALGLDAGIQLHFKIDGTAEITNKVGTVTLGPDGSITGQGPVGSFAMDAAGIFDVNGNLKVLP